MICAAFHSGNKECKSGRLNLSVPLDKSDGFINPLERVGIKRFRMCSRLLPHLLQDYEHVFRFIAQAIHNLPFPEYLVLA